MIPEKAQFFIDQLQLLKHPEGGWYKETYRATGEIPDSALAEYDGPRNFSTGIYFLLTKDNFSAFHRIKSDEMWHFYAGDGLIVHEIQTDGAYIEHHLGLRLEDVEEPQLVVKANSWFASEVKGDGNWCLVGCTVAPGFDFRDFELVNFSTLSMAYPEHTALIRRLTRS
jgi:hypothetical protein